MEHRETRPPLRPADLRKAVTEWAAQGFTVHIAPDGGMTVSPAHLTQKSDQFDQVDFARR